MISFCFGLILLRYYLAIIREPMKDVQRSASASGEAEAGLSSVTNAETSESAAPVEAGLSSSVTDAETSASAAPVESELMDDTQGS